MVGILLVAHNGLGHSFADCVRHVLGQIPSHLKVMSVLAEDDPQQKLAEGQALVAALDQGDGVLILTDVFGATPSNIAKQLCQPGRVMGVAGLNLPMLLRVVCSPQSTLTELTDTALHGGKKCIVYLDEESCIC